MRDASLRLLPDFVGCPMIVSFPVAFVRIVVGIEILIWMCTRQLSCQADCAISTVGWIGIKNVGAVALQDLFAFARNILRYAESAGKSFGRAQHGIRDPSIAAGGIEQNLPGTELAAASGFGDDVSGGAIFNRSAGIVPFGLTQKCYTGQVGGERVETQEGSVADTLDQALTQGFAQS